MIFAAAFLTSEQADSHKMAEEREASVQLLKTFAPLDGLKRDNLAALAKKVSVRTMPAGRVLFKEGDTDKRTVLARRRHGRDAGRLAHRRHDPRRHARSAQSALTADSPQARPRAPWTR